MSTWVSDFKGNIVVLESKSQNGRFSMLLVVKGICSENEESLKQHFVDDERFEIWKIV